MKLICRKSDGALLGRVADDQLRFALPADACVVESPEDISADDLPNGSTLAQIIDAKNAAFLRSHPAFTAPFQANLEFVTPDSDFTFAGGTQRVMSGPGKTTSLMAGYGATWTSGIIACVPAPLHICARMHFFLLGQRTSGSNVRHYNFSEVIGGFVDNPTAGFACTMSLIDATDGQLISLFESDVESVMPVSMRDFRVQVEVHPAGPGPYEFTDMRLYLSGFSLLTRQAIIP